MSLQKRIAEIAEDLIKDVEIDEICDDVFSTLNFIDVHELSALLQNFCNKKQEIREGRFKLYS